MESTAITSPKAGQENNYEFDENLQQCNLENLDDPIADENEFIDTCWKEGNIGDVDCDELRMTFACNQEAPKTYIM